MGLKQFTLRTKTSFNGAANSRSWSEAPQEKARSSSLSARRRRSSAFSFFLLYSSLHISHSSQSNIMSMFLTCCTLAENGRVFFCFFVLRDARCSSLVGCPNTSWNGRKWLSTPGVGCGNGFSCSNTPSGNLTGLQMSQSTEPH